MVQPIVSIDGKALNTFSTLTLNQSMYDHHTFDLVVGHDIIEDLGGHVLEKSKTWIGKDFLLEFGDNEFKGIVTSITMDHNAGVNGDLIISGTSPTILLEAGPHLQSWNKKTLKKIVSDVIAEAGIKSKVAPKYAKTLEYMAQYQESHFGFLQRLAATFHEWMYYDGKTLIFGKPSDLGKPIDVVYGTDLDNIQISMRMVPVNRKGYSYNSGQDENLSASTTGEVTGLNGLGSEALSAATDKFALEPQGGLLPRVSDKSELEEALKNKQAAAAARLTSITGIGKKMELKPGVVADIHAAVKNEAAWELKPYGKYLILNIQHHFTGNHEYSNHFEAIPAELEILPEPRVKLPVAEPQIATVLSNTDPEKQGRVQVKFLWQGDDMKSPWLRVMTPDAGTSDKVSSNRGLVTIPEKGDQVMVGFRYNDPMRPFVLGSMFHGKSGSGGGSGNKTKSLTTRSGNTITFDDAKGSITISDAKNCSMSMDGAGNISISSGSSITLSTGESSISMKSDGTIAITGLNITICGSESTTSVSGSSSFSTVPAEANVSSKTVNVSGSKEVSVNGNAKTSVSSSGKVEVSGAIVTLN